MKTNILDVWLFIQLKFSSLYVCLPNFECSKLLWTESCRAKGNIFQPLSTARNILRTNLSAHLIRVRFKRKITRSKNSDRIIGSTFLLLPCSNPLFSGVFGEISIPHYASHAFELCIKNRSYVKSMTFFQETSRYFCFQPPPRLSELWHELCLQCCIDLILSHWRLP